MVIKPSPADNKSLNKIAVLIFSDVISPLKPNPDCEKWVSPDRERLTALQETAQMTAIMPGSQELLDYTVALVGCSVQTACITAEQGDTLSETPVTMVTCAAVL